MGVRGVLPSPDGDARTTGSRETIGGAGGGAVLAEELAFPDESVEGEPGLQSPRCTSRGDGWCLGTVAIAMRAGMEGLW